jgi:capsular exopolysaccharide synthesis family protein
MRQQVVQSARELPGLEASRPAARDGYAYSPSLVMLSDPHGAAAEAIRAVRTHIISQHVREGRRALVICGASGGVGCTFVAANLAVALSQVGIKTLLVDGNLRTPSIHQVIRPPKLVNGLRHCLSTPGLGVAEYIDAGVQPNLGVLYSGGAAPNPQELLSSGSFEALMDYCMREYDFTIVDAPPANTSSDARWISTVCGYSLIVARRNVSLVEDVRTLMTQIRADRGRVIGTVLNEA